MVRPSGNCNPCCFLHRFILFFAENENQQLFELHLQVRVTPDSGAFPYVLFQFMQVRSRLCTLCILKFAICALLYQYLRILDIENGIRMRENVKFVYKMLMKVASSYWMDYYYKIYKFDIFITC